MKRIRKRGGRTVALVNGLSPCTSARKAQDLIRRGRAVMDAAGRLVLLDHETAARIEARDRRNRQDVGLDEAVQRGRLLTAREARRVPILDFARAIGQGKNTGGRPRAQDKTWDPEAAQHWIEGHP